MTNATAFDILENAKLYLDFCFADSSNDWEAQLAAIAIVDKCMVQVFDTMCEEWGPLGC
jgi:hypothetical protein